ncbi:MAG: glycosyltransferase [Oscillospiraceae bacterium]|jgi:1,2-diacylglycerol 3-alpha-glucosyltransferase|nr:glycosyltransferase [Oscillospiraceae bacterium]
MRIAIFVETYLPFINGVVTHVKALKEGLESLGHNVLVVSAYPNARRHYIKDGVLHCPSLRLKKLYGFGLAAPVSRTRMKYLEEFNPDICHVHQEFGIGLFGVLAAGLLRKPIVYTLHTMYDEYIYYVAPWSLVPIARSVSHRYAKYIADRACALTGPSDKVRQYFRSIGVTSPVTVIPNPVELDAFSPESVNSGAADMVREKYNIGRDRTLALFVGRLGTEKSVHVVLDNWGQTISERDGLHLLIVGDGPARGSLEEQARRLGISGMVTFAGKVLHEKLPPYYAAGDAYVTASLSDTYSISMLEAMAMGLPVIQRYDEMNKNQVVDGLNGYTFNGAEEMAAALKSIRDMPGGELADFRAATRGSVKAFGSEDLGRALEIVYREAQLGYAARRAGKRKLLLLPSRKSSKKDSGKSDKNE